MKRTYLRDALIFLALVGGLTGCSIVRARPAERAGFVPQSVMLEETRERAPFHGYWVREPKYYDALRLESGKIYIAPVDVHFAVEIYSKASGSDTIKRARIAEVQELGRYFHERLRLTLGSIEGRRFSLVQDPGPDVFNLRLALVQIIPTNPGVNVVGTAAGFFVPGGGLIKIFGEGSVAMEGYTERGSATEDPSQIWEGYADREGQKTSPFSLKDYQKFAHIRVAIDEWVKQIGELLNTKYTETIEDRDLISINPL
jgi:hypothetical protein